MYIHIYIYVYIYIYIYLHTKTDKDPRCIRFNSYKLTTHCKHCNKLHQTTTHCSTDDLIRFDSYTTPLPCNPSKNQYNEQQHTATQHSALT